MIYSRTAEYAIRALAYIASKPGATPAGAREISRETRAPEAYTAKILRSLARSGILASSHGRVGGFMLRRDPSKVSLMEVIDAVDNPKKSQLTGCVMGLKVCGSANPCPLHAIWTLAKERMMKKLKTTFLTDIKDIVELFPPGKMNRNILSKEVHGVFEPR